MLQSRIISCKKLQSKLFFSTSSNYKSKMKIIGTLTTIESSTLKQNSNLNLNFYELLWKEYALTYWKTDGTYLIYIKDFYLLQNIC